MPFTPLAFCPASSSFNPPCFLVNPPCLPCRCIPLLVLRSLSVSSSLMFSTSLGHSLDLISDCPCQLIYWCFLLYFHLPFFLQGLSGAVNSSGCQISPHCLLVRDILSSLQWSQPTGLSGDLALDPLDISRSMP